MLTRGQEYRRGWTVLVASAVGSGVGVAVLSAYSLGALMKPLNEAFGWDRGAVGAVAMFHAFGVLLAGAGVGALADRFGARRVAIVSQLTLAIALASLTFVTADIWTLYLGYFLLAILGAGTLPMIWGRAIIGWFVRGRGVALGLSLVGTGAIGASLPTYITWLTGTFGWHGAFLGMAALPLFIGLPFALLFFREPPPELAAEAVAGTELPADDAGHTFAQAAQTLCFWQMSIAFIIASVSISGVLVHALPLLTDRGIDKGAAAALAGLFGLAVIVGRLISGFFLDVFKGPVVGLVIFVLSAAACGLLLVSGDNLLLCGTAILIIGLSGGAESDIAAYLVAKYFGRANYGAIYGLLYTLYGIGGGIGPMLVGGVYEGAGSYDMALIGAIAIFLIAALLIGTVRPPRLILNEEASR